MKSIQSRLTSGLLISLLGVFLLLWFIVSSNIQKLAENYIASRLEHDIESLITATQFDRHNTIKVAHERLDTVYNQPFSGHYYIIQHQQQVIRSRSLWDQNLNIPEISSPDYLTRYAQGPENQKLLVITARFNKQNQLITISAAEDLTPVAKDIRRFNNYFGLTALLVLLILIMTQVVILRQGLKPLRKIRQELNELEQGKITELSPVAPYEIKPVIDEINHLTRAMHKRIKRSRDALSDLSHAIKKPLTVLQQFTDKNQASLDETSLDILNRQISDIQQITDRILKRARVAGQSQFNQPFRIDKDLGILLQTIKSMYPDKKIEPDIDITEPLDIQVDREDMLELMGNLLDNAWKWANNQINIQIRKTDTLYICIEDDGPGSNQGALKNLAERGLRMDESVEGYGFGLAIVSDIVHDYDGQLDFGQSEKLGGFKAVIRIPIKSDV